jgi:hypothetical protein
VFDDDVGFRESGIHITAFEFHPGGDVRRARHVLERLAAGFHVGMQNRRVLRERALERHRRREHFVLDPHQSRRLARDFGGGGRDGSDRMAVVQDLLVRHRIVAHVAEIERAFPAEPYLLVGPGNVAAGDDRLHAGQRLRGGRID